MFGVWIYPLPNMHDGGHFKKLYDQWRREAGKYKKLAEEWMKDYDKLKEK